MPGAAGGADTRDDGENDILGCNADGKRPIDADPHATRPALPQRLGREYMGYLGGADAESERPKRAVRRGVTVAADHQKPRLGDALLGPDDVHDALAPVAETKQRDAVLPCIIRQRADHLAAIWL